ncbi:unnamed protein product, partial [Brenthis ino]
MLEIYYQNVRGLRTKTNDVFKNIANSNYKVIVFTETWLNDNIENNEWIDSRYVVYRKDRIHSSSSKKDGGGVAIAVAKEIPSFRASYLDNDHEIIWVIIETKINKNIRKLAVCAAYLPPPVKLENLNNILENIDSASNKVDDIIVLGDFNMSFISWSSDARGHASASSFSTPLGFSLIDFMALNNLHQYNSIGNLDDIQEYGLRIQIFAYGYTTICNR